MENEQDGEDFASESFGKGSHEWSKLSDICAWIGGNLGLLISVN